MKLILKLKTKFAIFTFWLVQNLILLNTKMIDLKTKSKAYLKHPTAIGIKEILK
jgi:hypothetical protein